jgi:drug/metabolite transporter (DMT)-like permease
LNSLSPLRLTALCTLALLAFAGNSLLCRLALLVGESGQPSIDAVTFTTVRMASGAVALAIIVALRGVRLSGVWQAGNWASAAALFGYAIAFSLAYTTLGAAIGALLLFGAVQVTMISRGLWAGERFRPLQWAGFASAVLGLVALLLPAPGSAGGAASNGAFLLAAALMVAAGACWGVYSLRGKAAANPDPTLATAGHFARTLPFAVGASALAALLASAHVLGSPPHASATGLWLAVASGALTSGVGYAIWYAALPGLKATTAATLQLSVPVITALAAVALLNEALTLRLVLASIAVLGGVALVLRAGPRK